MTERTMTSLWVWAEELLFGLLFAFVAGVAFFFLTPFVVEHSSTDLQVAFGVMAAIGALAGVVLVSFWWMIVAAAVLLRLVWAFGPAETGFTDFSVAVLLALVPSVLPAVWLKWQKFVHWFRFMSKHGFLD